jgi:hypothetical protein
MDHFRTAGVHLFVVLGASGEVLEQERFGLAFLRLTTATIRYDEARNVD